MFGSLQESDARESAVDLVNVQEPVACTHFWFRVARAMGSGLTFGAGLQIQYSHQLQSEDS